MSMISLTLLYSNQVFTNINSPTVMTFSSGEKKFKYVKNVEMMHKYNVI